MKNVRPARMWQLPVLSYGVAANGLIMIAGVLEDTLSLHVGRHFGIRANHLVFNAPIVLGLCLLYMALLIRRGKRTAWVATVALYGVILCFNIFQLYILSHAHHAMTWPTVRNVLLPLAAVAALLWARASFTVRSDVQSFASAARFSMLVLTATFVYGVAGFTLMEVRDFHHSISVLDAAHRTIDQFGLTTSAATVPHTHRAHLFVDSLSMLSTGAVLYAGLSFFQPLRARLSDHDGPRIIAARLLAKYPGNSEDFFKVWPHDKHYFFNTAQTAGLAYGVSRGTAIVVGDPFGNPQAFSRLLASFDQYCHSNDWRPAFVHTLPAYQALYKKHGFAAQKIGEEAVVDVVYFQTTVRTGKYFRQIQNKFIRHGYRTALLAPPHDAACIARLHAISNDWLQRPGREERGFALGSFGEAYMQQCTLMVLLDEAGVIQAFINQVPTYDPHEANYDLLRYTSNALGNANDFLLMEFIGAMQQAGYKRLNLGLCLLAGVGDERGKTLVDSALRVLYARGDRLYSFSGLHRFKAKYQPVWSDRYIMCRGGVAGFTRATAAFGRLSKI